jgi:predicted RNA-binding protein with RPS1 domain
MLYRLSFRDCEVKGVHSWGVFVEVLPGREGLVHVSELDTVRVSISPLPWYFPL